MARMPSAPSRSQPRGYGTLMAEAETSMQAALSRPRRRSRGFDLASPKHAKLLGYILLAPAALLISYILD